MSYKRRHPYRLPIYLFSFTALSFIFLVVFGLILLQTELIVFDSHDETVLEITDSGEYYVLLDTEGVRYKTSIENVGFTNKLILTTNDDEEIFVSSFLARGESDTQTVTPSEFDKQIRYKNHLSFGRITLAEDTYTFDSVVLSDNDAIGNYALLNVSYVNSIGLFSLSAIIMLLFGLLGFKYYRTAKSIPLSKYQIKHLRRKDNE